jgi:hypothetical protein
MTNPLHAYTHTHTHTHYLGLVFLISQYGTLDAG